MEDLRVVAERIRLVAARYHDVAGQLDAQRSRAASALTALGAPWGVEAAGSTFARTYVPSADAALGIAGHLTRTLDDVAARLTAHLAETEGADRAAGESFHALRSALERDED